MNLFHVPKAVLVEILSQFITVKSLVKFDSALSRKSWREDFLNLCQAPFFIVDKELDLSQLKQN